MRYKIILFFSLLLFLIFISRISSFYVYPNVDTGVFAYIGDMILEGKIPYRDVWDHKSPLIYYTNALIFYIFGRSFKSIAFFEIIWVFIACICIYKLFNKIFSKRVNLFLTFIFATYFSSIGLAESIGMTETYLILPSILAIFFILQYETTLKKYYLFGCGLMVSFSFLFKQSGIVVVLPIFLYLLMIQTYRKERFQTKLKSCLIFFAGISLPLFIFFIYFLTKDALMDAFSQIFIYNFYYSKVKNYDLFTYIFKLFYRTFYKSFFAKYPFLIILGITTIYFKFFDFLKNVKNKNFFAALYKERLFFLTFLWFICDLYAISFSGRYFGHYFVQLLPSLSLLSGFMLKYFIENVDFLPKIKYFLVIFFIIPSPILKNIYDNLYFAKKFFFSTNESNVVCIDGKKYFKTVHTIVAKWIKDNTSDDEYVYFWHAETGLNFLTKRKSPTKYTYLYPFYMMNYIRQTDIEIFISDLKKNPPKFIVDATDNNFLKTIFELENKTINEILLPVYQFIKAHYEYYTSIDGWDIYVHKPNK